MSGERNESVSRSAAGRTKPYDWDHDCVLPAGLYDVAANETWLEEQEAKGWRAVCTTDRRICFAACAPGKCRYRFQPLQKRREVMDQERISLYGSLGWEYIGKVGSLYHLWRCADAASPELDTDPVVQAEGYRYLKRRMMRTVLTELAFLLGLLVLCLGSLADGDTVLRNILRDSVPLEMLLQIAALACAIPWEVMEVRTMGRLLRRLKTGIPLERPRPYKGKRWAQRGIMAVFIVYLGLRTVNLFWSTGNGEILGRNAMEGDVPGAGMVYVDVTALEVPDDVVEFTCERTKTHELAHVTQVVMRQLHREGPGRYLVTANADTTYYDLRFSWMAPALVEDIRCAYRNWEPFTEIDTPCLDRFLVTSYEDRGNVAIAVKDGKVLELFYSGGTDLGTLDAYLAGLLAQ